MKECQFCGITKGVRTWIPAGDMCEACRKALQKIRKDKLGFGWLPK